jgi:hypothetical protein
MLLLLLLLMRLAEVTAGRAEARRCAAAVTVHIHCDLHVYVASVIVIVMMMAGELVVQTAPAQVGPQHFIAALGGRHGLCMRARVCNRREELCWLAVILMCPMTIVLLIK